MISIKTVKAEGNEFTMAAESEGKTLAACAAALTPDGVEILGLLGDAEYYDGVIRAALGFAFRRGIENAYTRLAEHFSVFREMGFRDEGDVLKSKINEIFVCKFDKKPT